MVRLAHLSDLHVRAAGDLDRFDAQLRTLAHARIDHLVITGDLLERWDPRLLDATLDALRGRGFYHRDRLTIIHGNHDLASVGALHSPRERRRLLVRFWDPEPLLLWRRRSFYRRLRPLYDDNVTGLPLVKADVGGVDLLAIDTVPTRFRPIAVRRASEADAEAPGAWMRIELRHAIGTVPETHASWLASLGPPVRPRVLLLHHYPLETPPLVWRRIIVPMEIPAPRRERLWHAIQAARVSLVLCGHVHRSRLERMGRVSVGLEGTSGGAWADDGASIYEVDEAGIVARHERIATIRRHRGGATMAQG